MRGFTVDEYNDISILLLKPDGYASDVIRDYTDDTIEAFGLRQVGRYRYLLTEEDVLDLWPKFGSNKYPISCHFNMLYLTGGPSEVIIVKGSDVARRCDEIKRLVRTRFGAGMFCNAMHSPSGELEIRTTVKKFARAKRDLTPFVRHDDDGATAGIWGPLAQTSLEEILQVVARLWDRKESSGWTSLRRSQRSGGPYCVRLLSGDPHSIDYGMSALRFVMPEYDVEEVMRIYLEADVFGAGTVASGKRYAMQTVKEALRAYGLYADMLVVDSIAGGGGRWKVLERGDG